MALRFGVGSVRWIVGCLPASLSPYTVDVRRNPQCNNQNGSRYFQTFRSQGVGVRSDGLSPIELHQYKPSEKIYSPKTIINFGAAKNYIESFANSLSWSYIKSILFKNPAPVESYFSSKTHLFSTKPYLFPSPTNYKVM